MEREEEAEEQRMSPKSARNMLEENFSAFAKFNDPEGRDGISLPNIKMWFARAALLEVDYMELRVLDEVFEEVAGKHPRLSVDAFNSFLDGLTDRYLDKNYLVKQLALATVPTDSDEVTVSDDTFENHYSAFAKVDDRLGRRGITFENIENWFQRAALMEENGITAEVLAEAFAEVGGTHRTFVRLTFRQFQAFVDILAEKTNISRPELVEKLTATTIPVLDVSISPGVSQVMLEEHFWAFAKLDDRMGRRGIKLKNIEIWFERAELFNENFITRKLLAEAYEEVGGIHRHFNRLTFHAFPTFLVIVAEKTNIGRPYLEEKLTAVTLPDVDISTEVGAGSTGAGSNILESEKESDSSSVTGGGAGASGAGGKTEKE